MGAVDVAGSVAAPLLAGFSVTLIAQVIDNENALWWADLAFLLLVLAAVFLVAAVQAAFMARQYAVTPSELEEWWPDLEHPSRWRQVRSEQWAHAEVARVWSLRFRRAYQIGLVALLSALPVVLVPDDAVDPLRIAAIAVAGAAAAAGALWVAADIALSTSGRRAGRHELRSARKEIRAIRRRNERLPEQLTKVEERMKAKEEQRRVLREREKLKRTSTVERFPRPLRPLAGIALAGAARVVPQLQEVEPPASVATVSCQREIFAASPRVESLLERLVEALETSEHDSDDATDSEEPLIDAVDDGDS